MPVLLLLAACAGGGAAGGAGVVVRDSAGIEIVEHSAEVIAALPVWGVIGEPLVDIGGGEDPAEQFTAIWGVVRLTDGRLVVHDNRASELRLFDAEGRFVRLVAGAGEGPGEIRGAGFPHWLPGDTLAVTDQQRRTAYFGPDGQYLRQVTHPRPALESASFAVLWTRNDGSALGMIHPQMGAPESMSLPPTRHPLPLVLVSSEGAILDTVVVGLGPQSYPVMFAEGGQEFPTWSAPIFGVSTHVAVNEQYLVVGTNERNEIQVYRGTALQRLIRNATPAAPVTEEEVARYKAPTLARYAAQNAPEAAKQRWREDLERQRVADHFPFHDRITIARDGSLWVQGFRPVSTDPYRFLVYGENGRAVARVELPEGVRPWHLDREHIAGVWLDADDVPHVRVWRVGPSTD